MDANPTGRAERPRLAVLLAQRSDGDVLTALLRGNVAADVVVAPPSFADAGEAADPGLDQSRTTALLVVDGRMLWRYAAWIRARRGPFCAPKMSVLLLLGLWRGRAWPEQAYRELYDDVLQAPIERQEALLRVRQLLALQATETKNAHLLRRSRDDAERLAEEKTKRAHLIAMLGHDLRSPLTAARLGAQRLARDCEPAVRNKRIERVVSSLDRIDTMITALLETSRTEAELKTREPYHRCNLRQLVDATVAELAQVHPNDFVVEVAAQLDVVVQQGVMVRVLENLCNNAVKYGCVGRPVQVQAFVEAGEVCFQVANEGAPLATGSLDTLFEPYRRSQAQQEEPSSIGWGIGLSVVRSAAEAHRGRVRVYRDDAGRNVFGLQFPADLPKAAQNVRSDASCTQGGGSSC